MPRGPFMLLWGGALGSVAAVSGAAVDQPTQKNEPAPVLVIRNLKPRDRLVVGDRWRIRVSHYPMHLPEPEWESPETWHFAVTGVEKTREGPRLIVTASRDGAVQPTVRLELDADTGALKQVETTLPVPGGERKMVERPIAGQPFVSELSPVPLAFAMPEAWGSQEPPADRPAPAAGASAPSTDAGPQAFAFSFGPRLSQRTEPVEPAVGRAKIERGMGVLRLARRARMEPDGVPRYLTRIEGPGLRIEQIWDETTPWPIYAETDTSRSWLVAYTKGK